MGKALLIFCYHATFVVIEASFSFGGRMLLNIRIYSNFIYTLVEVISRRILNAAIIEHPNHQTS